MLHLKKHSLPLLLLLTFCLNVLIYFRAMMTIEPAYMVFAECARNSGRTSAALNLAILFMLGHIGLKTIYKDDFQKKILLSLVVLFAFNHLIHFFFVVQNFKIRVWDMDITRNIHGFITYICLLILPLILFKLKSLNKTLYIIILLHFFNITYFISESFYSRYKPVDPAYLHRLGVLVMIVALLYILYRVFAESSINFKVDKRQIRH